MAGTLVTMCDGSQIAIEHVEPGDWVLSKDEDSGELVCQEVQATSVREGISYAWLELVDEEGNVETLGVTDEHPIWVAGKSWVRAEQLKVGDTLLSHQGQWLKVSSNTWAQEATTVYNFSVEATHSYFVGEVGVWVHNTNEDECFKFLSAKKKDDWLSRRQKDTNVNGDTVEKAVFKLQSCVRIRTGSQAGFYRVTFVRSLHGVDDSRTFILGAEQAPWRPTQQNIKIWLPKTQ